MLFKKGSIDDQNLFFTNNESKDQHQLFSECKNLPHSLKIDEKAAIFDKLQSFINLPEGMDKDTIEELVEFKKTNRRST